MSFNTQKYALCYKLPSSGRWLCETNYDSVESIDKRAFELKPVQTTFIPYKSNLFLHSRLTYKLSTVDIASVHLHEQ